MRHIFTRQQLYDLIWERAVSKVAPELGISDVGLRKQCITHAIPLPDATYWGKRNAGKAAARKPLPPLPKNVSDQIVIIPRSVSAAPEPVHAAIREARAATSATRSSARPNSLVAATMAAAKRAKPDRDWGAISNLGPEYFRIRAHPDTFDRMDCFLTDLTGAAEARGWRFAPGRAGLDAIVDDEAISFSISQTIRRLRYVATPEEQRRIDRWHAERTRRNAWVTAEDLPPLPWWRCTPTGEMRLEVDSWPYATGVSRNFADTRTRKLEDRIDDILVSFAAHAAARKVERVRETERQRREELMRIERARLARLAKLEQVRVDWLTKKLAEQAHVEALRRFIAGLGEQVSNGPSFEKMRSWASERLAAAEARLTAEALAAEVTDMEAFVPTDGAS